MYSRSWDYKTSFYSGNTNNMLILARHVSWDMRSSCFYQVISETMIAISETMTVQIVQEVQIALMTAERWPIHITNIYV